MKVTFLGTAAGQPSLERNTTSIAIEIDKSEYIMVDCGEATTHQLMRSKLKFHKLHSIFITHLHGDHIYGLPGLLCTMNHHRTEPLTIYGPSGIKEFCSIFYSNIKSFQLNIHELHNEYNDVCTLNFTNFKLHVESCIIKHTTECMAYSFTRINLKHKTNMLTLEPVLTKYKQDIINMGFNPPQKIIKWLNDSVIENENFEFKIGSNSDIFKAKDFIIKQKPFKIIVALDNFSCQNIFTYFQTCDVLVHESTYNLTLDDSEEDQRDIKKKCKLHGHSTNIMAAINAERIGACSLILTHFSNRYKFTDGKMTEEQKIIDACRINSNFKGNIHAAYDFSEFNY
jgi:ribonuclease Z